VEHVVTLHRTGGAKLGFTFDTKSPVPKITKVVPGGLLDLWNQKHPGGAVKVGDEIIEVNGVQGSTSIFLAAFKTSTLLKIKLWRRAYSITLDKSDASPLGLSLSTDSAAVLVVTGINSDGLVGQWNMRHPEAQVQLGDEILEVNDQRGNANLLYQECTKNKPLRMKLWRRRLLKRAPKGQHYFSMNATRVFEETYWPRFTALFLVEGTPNYPMPPGNKVPDLLEALRGSKGLAVHTEPGVTVTEGQGYAMFAAGMRKDVQALMGLTAAWQAAGQGFADGPACGGCGARCSGSLSGSCLCKTVPGAYMPGWSMPMDKDWKMGSATDGDQDAITGLIYLAELTNSDEFRKYAVRSITAFVLEDMGYANVTENSRRVPIIGEIPEKHQTMYLWRTGTCGGGFDRTSHDVNHDLCLSPGYFSPGQWRLFQRYLKKHAALVPAPYSADKLGEVLESAIVWGYNMLQRIACPNGIVSNWWSLPAKGWPYQGKLQCSNSGTQAGAYYSDAARIPWRVVLDYLWFPDAKTPFYDEQGKLGGTFGAKEYANRWAGAWMKLIQSATTDQSAGKAAQLTKDGVIGLLSKLDTCKTVPYGFTALPKNGWGSLPVVTTFQVPMDDIAPCVGQEWLDYLANITLDQVVNTQYFDLGQEVIISSMIGGNAWLPLSSTELMITLDKADGQEIGLDLDQRGPVLFVKSIREGLVKAWNQRNPFWEVREGDEIVAVNDITDDVAKQVGEIRTNQHLMIRLWRTDQTRISSCSHSSSVPLVSETAPSPSPSSGANAAVPTGSGSGGLTASPAGSTARTTSATPTTNPLTTTATVGFSTAMPSSTSPLSASHAAGQKVDESAGSKTCASVNRQCGGKQWNGTTCCQAGCHCKAGGPYYSQCVPPPGKTFCNESDPVMMDDIGMQAHLAKDFVRWRPTSWPVGLGTCAAVVAAVLSLSLTFRRQSRARRLQTQGYMPAFPTSPSHSSGGV